MQKQQRPKFLNLFKIRLPVTGVASILHRISGVLLFLCIPISLYLLQRSVQSADAYQQVINCLSGPVAKIVAVLFLWAFIHHLLAGFRFLLIDLNVGMSLKVARRSAWWVMAIVPLLLIFSVWRWWL